MLYLTAMFVHLPLVDILPEPFPFCTWFTLPLLSTFQCVFNVALHDRHICRVAFEWIVGHLKTLCL